jgi:hypothetical protein
MFTHITHHTKECLLKSYALFDPLIDTLISSIHGHILGKVKVMIMSFVTHYPFKLRSNSLIIFSLIIYS